MPTLKKCICLGVEGTTKPLGCKYDNLWETPLKKTDPFTVFVFQNGHNDKLLAVYVFPSNTTVYLLLLLYSTVHATCFGLYGHVQV